jgi:hypothetical protein
MTGPRRRSAAIAAVVVALAAFAPGRAFPVPTAYVESLASAARAADPAFAGFSAARGRDWFIARHGSDWSCATCHTDDPRAAGRHATTGRAIAPLAPAANVERLTDVAKIEKWFRRNCNDVVGRACSPQEKGDVVAWLTSLKQ